MCTTNCVTINRIFYMIFPLRWEQGLETYQVGQRPQSPWWSQECKKTDLFPVSLLSDWELLPRELLDWNWEEARGHLVISRGLTHSLSSLSLIPVSALNLQLRGSLFPRLLHTEALPSPFYASTCDSIVNSLMLTLCGLRTFILHIYGTRIQSHWLELVWIAPEFSRI